MSYLLLCSFIFVLATTEIVSLKRIDTFNNKKITYLQTTNINEQRIIENKISDINFIQSEGPVISVTLPKKKVRVHIVGCIHSSSTAVTNVKNVINTIASNPKAVVLELCSRRYKSLQDDKVLLDSNQGDQINHEKEINNIDKVGFLVYCLSVLTYAQRPLKIVPGAEFLAAMSEAERRNIPIEMGDEEVEKIIQNLKSVGNIKGFIENPIDILKTIQTMAFSITGNYDFISMKNNKDFSKLQWLNILPAFFSDRNLVRDTLILMSPSIIPLTFVTVIANYIMENYQSFPFSSFLTSSINPSSDYLYQLADILTNIFTIYWGLVVTNIFRYVIVERDRIIAMKISDICNKISKENENNNNEISDVICVLGMLHSNGVVRYLLEE
jgi:pheromone shutdown protein TraB